MKKKGSGIIFFEGIGNGIDRVYPEIAYALYALEI